MGLSTALAVGAGGSSLASVLQAGLSIAQASARYRAQKDAAKAQEKDVNETADEKASDIVRQSRADLASAQVAADAFGASSGSMMRIMAEISGLEGINLARTELSRRSVILGINQDLANAEYDKGMAVTGAVLKGFAEVVGAGWSCPRFSGHLGGLEGSSELAGRAHSEP